MGLNPYQQRAVAITLRLIEERLAEIEDLLDRGAAGVLFRRPPAPLDAERRRRLEALVGQVRESIAELAGALHLPREEQDPIRRIIALLNISWENLGEIDSRRLRAYGAVDPELRSTLDPAARRLADLVFALQAELAGGEGGDHRRTRPSSEPEHADAAQ